MASFRQFMLLAVNIPEHEPQVGHADRSRFARSASVTLASLDAIIGSMRSSLRMIGLPSRPCVPTSLPASMGPPETKIVGTLSRIAASSIPGVILSQFEMQTSASAQCALTMYSTLSAMSSRLGSEYSIPPWPMAMPSSTAIVLNSTPHPPAASMTFFTRCPDVVQVHVPRNELREAVGDGDDRLLEVRVGHPGGAPERARPGHVASRGRGAAPVTLHAANLRTAAPVAQRRKTETPANAQQMPINCGPIRVGAGNLAAISLRVHMSIEKSPMEHFDVLIVGAGLSGIGAGYHLQTNCPERTYAILEARDCIGGTWDLFRYPGIRSDSDMYTLGYSFRPWTNPKAIADGPSILSYVRDTAAALRHRQEDPLSATASRARRGRRRTRSGPSKSSADLRARSCASPAPSSSCAAATTTTAPATRRSSPGIDRFSGRVVHPAEVADDIDYAGKRVVVIGSGATAVTLVPAMARDGRPRHDAAALADVRRLAPRRGRHREPDAQSPAAAASPTASRGGRTCSSAWPSSA